MAEAQKYRLDDDNVAIVIGSGAGGGTLANALAQNGIDVVCLEAGDRLTFADIVNNQAEMFAKFTWLDERVGIGEAPAGFPLWTCKTVGGSTMHWTAVCPRLQEHEIRAKSTYGSVKGTNLADWPLEYQELESYYERAEDRLGVTGTHGIDFLPGSNNYKVFETGARKAGYKDIDTNRMAINSRPRDGRPACLQTGFCASGCVIGAKWSTLYTEIPQAEKSGRFELRSNCMVTRILTGKNGLARGIQYLDGEGKLREQRGRFVCIAGNAVETTRLLLNSRTQRHPHGLANSSEQVGRNYMRHVLAAVVAIMPGEVHMYKGTTCAGIVRDETHYDPSRGFQGGFLWHTVSFSPEDLVQLMLTGQWGHKVTEVMDKYKYMAAALMVGEDMAEPNNRISLHPHKKDRYGLPVPVVEYHYHANSVAMRTHALKVAHNIYNVLGAEQIFDMKTFPATHNMGVARMGDDPRISVCNRWGQTHDIKNLFISDGSVFPSSGCANPTLTIVSLALRQADYIAGQSKLGLI